MAGSAATRHAVDVLLDTLFAVLPLLCAALVVAGVALDRGLDRRGARLEERADERFAFALLADALIRSLDLRPDCRDALCEELRRERALVRAWLESTARR
jgi:hypothetical protein